MVSVHHAVAFVVIAICFGAAAAGGWAYYRKSEPRAYLMHLPALAQTIVTAQAAIGPLPLDDYRPMEKSTISTAASRSSPSSHDGLRAQRPAGPPRLVDGAALVAGALAVRAYMRGPGSTAPFAGR